MATYYCFSCCLVFDASINPPTEVKKNTFECQNCIAKKDTRNDGKTDAERERWISEQGIVLGKTI